MAWLFRDHHLWLGSSIYTWLSHFRNEFAMACSVRDEAGSSWKLGSRSCWATQHSILGMTSVSGGCEESSGGVTVHNRWLGETVSIGVLPSQPVALASTASLPLRHLRELLSLLEVCLPSGANGWRSTSIFGEPKVAVLLGMNLLQTTLTAVLWHPQYSCKCELGVHSVLMLVTTGTGS